MEELSPPPYRSQPAQPTSSQHSPTQNGATSPPKNSTTSHAASPPARPPATLYTPCKSPANLVHTNPFPTPIRNEILQYQPADPFVIVGGTTDPDLIMYKSKGDYDSPIPMSRDEFNSILAVTLVLIEGNETVVQLKWQRQKKRGFISDILRRTVLKKELFADHLNPLFPNGLEVLARHKIGNESKKFNESRSDHGFAAYTSGMCSHNAGVRRKNADIANKCPVKVVVGFTAADILSFTKNPSQTTIQLRIQVNENCLHKKHHNPNQLRGEQRSKYISEEGFTEKGNYKDPSPKAMYQEQHHEAVENDILTPTDQIVVKNRTIASNLKREMAQARMLSQGLVPGERTKNLWRAYHDIIHADLNRRKNYEKKTHPESPRPINTAHSGIIQTHQLLTEFATRQSTHPHGCIMDSG